MRPTKRLRRFHLNEEEDEIGKQDQAGLGERGSKKSLQEKSHSNFNEEFHKKSSLIPQSVEDPEINPFREKALEHQSSDEDGDENDSESDDLDGFIVSDRKDTIKNSLNGRFE